MKTIDDHGTFKQTLSRSSSQVKEIAERLRGLIIAVYPEVVEVP